MLYLQIQFASIYCVVFTNTICIHILCCILQIQFASIYCVVFRNTICIHILCCIYKYNSHPYIVLYLQIQFASIYCIVFANTISDPKEDFLLRLRFSILRMEVEVKINRMNCSKNANLTNIVTEAYKIKNLLIFKISLGQEPFSVG